MKIMVSACLAGENCKYNGGNNRSEKVLRLMEGNETVTVCPEQLGGLPTPRTPSEIRDGVVTAKDGQVTDPMFRAGAAKCLEIARREKPDLVVLQSRSPSCGVRQRYDGTFSGTLIDGPGVTAELLIENGFRCVDAGELLVTERLFMRRWEESDAAAVYEYAGDPAVGPPAGWPPHKNIEESLEVIRRVFSGPECRAVCSREDGKPIGCIELMFKNRPELEGDNECELGYWLGRPFWGRGLMTEAAEEMLRHAFEDLGMAKVWCGYYDGNDKSKRVQEKCGFRYCLTREGVELPRMNEIRTEHLNVLTRDEWLNERRIRYYEEIFDEAAKLLQAKGRSEAQNARLAGLVRELDVYYGSKEWREDLNADEAGLLPADLKRGVLSEDGIYDLLTEFGEA